MKILVDINVVLDVLLARQPWLDDAEAIWNSCQDGRIRGHLAATGVTNIFYIARRIVGLVGCDRASAKDFGGNRTTFGPRGPSVR